MVSPLSRFHFFILKNNRVILGKPLKLWVNDSDLVSSFIDGSEGLETHHKIPRVKGGSNEYKNLELVHISCHLEYHKVFPAMGETPNDIQLRSDKKYIKAKKL